MLNQQFLPGPNGRLYTNIYLPDDRCISTHWLIHVPAFAEEMNKSRHMINEQARCFSAHGRIVMVPDLYATGDSEGEFAEAEWESWRRDIGYLIKWARERGAKHITLWGLRLGALLAADVACSEENLVDHLLFWQPMVNGKQAMTQFLRLRLAAGMMSGEKERLSDLADRLQSGECMEVAGYQLSGKLFQQISECVMPDLTANQELGLDWLEVTASPERDINLQSRKLIDQWKDDSNRVRVKTAVGDPFWSTQELVWVPELVEKTTLLYPACQSEVESGVEFELATTWPQASPVQFQSGNNKLFGVLHEPDTPSARSIVIVVGGPQYRIGSHRQFVLLARAMAERGYRVLRFDYAGMGDSEGEYKGFEDIRKDIASAINYLFDSSSLTQEIVIWGLCDAATAAVFYAPEDSRVKGLVLVNPWVRSDEGEAKTLIRHYYLKRLLSRDFWTKVLTGRYNLGSSFNALNSNVKKATMSKMDDDVSGNLALRFESALQQFDGKTLFILSENDLTAAEFKDAVAASKGLGNRVRSSFCSWYDLPDADHTFSKAVWRKQVIDKTQNWIQEW